ncbi:signal peptide peptidase SppA [Clostridium sp. OM07-10AC]|nr:signal peptide peptidase SppA [Clostridium sp. OM07-9AC]RHV02066.1 signal peptide peptidase SppA [Clostridium sp. OM07-10AC]
MKKKQWIGIVVAGVVFIAVCATGILSNVVQSKLTEKADTKSKTSTSEMLSSIWGSSEENVTLPEEDFVGVLNIVGTIQANSSGNISLSGSDDGQYNHNLYMKYVDELEKSKNNKAILLYVNSPGGTVYESDELYLKLMEYKEKTKRPVYAYFGSQACSGAYYISMAADKIYTNRNTWTGSIGVIVSLTNYKKLYDKLGIKEIDITSGKNKSMGSGGLDLTDEQYDILQSLVDEAYDQFAGIVSEGRGIDIATVKKIADGRIYSAKQAKEKKLVDEIGTEDELKALIQKENRLSDDVVYDTAKSSGSNFLSNLMGSVQKIMPKSDSELAVDIIENKGKGVLMYYAD